MSLDVPAELADQVVWLAVYRVAKRRGNEAAVERARREARRCGFSVDRLDELESKGLGLRADRPGGFG